MGLREVEKIGEREKERRVLERGVDSGEKVRRNRVGSEKMIIIHFLAG